MNVLRSWSGFLTIFATAALAGCGVGYNQHAQRASTPVDSVDMRSQSISFYDASGIMLAAMGGAGNAYNAQQAAQKQAIANGAKAGDTYEYEYEVVPPAPGIWTSLTYAWGTGTSKLGQDVEYSLLDLRTTLGKWRILGFQSSFVLGATWSTYTNLLGESEFSDESNYIGMPMGMTFARRVTSRGTFSARASLDPIISLFQLAFEESWQVAEAGTRFDFRVIKNINLYADAYARRAVQVGDSDQWNEFVATAGLTFIFWEDKLKIFGGN